MAKTNFKSVDDYIASHPESTQLVLELVRSSIQKALPQAEESIAYQMPVYKLPAGPVLYFAGWKQHYSIYPASEGVLSTFSQDLAPYQIQKSTIRFPLAQPVPVKLIARIAKYRALEVAKRAP